MTSNEKPSGIPRQVIDQQNSAALIDKPSKLKKTYEETSDIRERGALIGGLITKWPNYDV